MNRADMGIAESGCGASFALKTLQGLPIAGKFVGQEFQGDKSAQAGVFRFVHDAHAAGADLLQNTIMRNHLARIEASLAARVMSLFPRAGFSRLNAEFRSASGTNQFFRRVFPRFHEVSAMGTWNEHGPGSQLGG